jgi:protease-4
MGDEQVGLIEVTGVITDATPVIEDLKRFRKDDDIKAIVVRVDSPGGGVGPSQEIYREIRKTVGEKKVVASMGSVAASGGYYIAAAADGIVASPGTITGSIGVIMQFANFQELLEKIGLRPVVVTAGEYKDIGSPIRPMRPEEEMILKELAAKIHRQFIRDVGAGRGMTPEEVESLADGRIFTGEESKVLGLVDRLGNLDDAVQWAGQMAGIDGEVAVVRAPNRTPGWLELITGSTLSELLSQVGRALPAPQAIYSPNL